MTSGRRIAVAGSRHSVNELLVRWAFRELGIGVGDTIVHGACAGADRMCAMVARSFGADTEAHPAEWKKYGKAAGPIRNRQMLESGVNLLVAFPGGRGTNNAVMTARDLGIPVWDLRGVDEQEEVL